MNGRIILCADDYAMAPGISRGVRMLAAAARISATSAIVTRPQWMTDAAAVKPFAPSLAIGLHLNLTSGAPLGPCGLPWRASSLPGIGRLIALSYTRALDPAGLTSEIERQLDAFEAGLGMPPDFVDGHEHAHVLPVIRATLLAVLHQRYGKRLLLIRDPSAPLSQAVRRGAPVVKSLLLRFLARNMRRDAERAHFISNDRFAGISGFAPSASAVANDFGSAATLDGWRPLVMCHPGLPDATSAKAGALSARRQAEFDALMAATPIIPDLWRPSRNNDGCIDWPMSPLERKL